MTARDKACAEKIYDLLYATVANRWNRKPGRRQHRDSQPPPRPLRDTSPQIEAMLAPNRLTLDRVQLRDMSE